MPKKLIDKSRHLSAVKFEKIPRRDPLIESRWTMQPKHHCQLALHCQAVGLTQWRAHSHWTPQPEPASLRGTSSKFLESKKWLHFFPDISVIMGCGPLPSLGFSTKSDSQPRFFYTNCYEYIKMIQNPALQSGKMGWSSLDDGVRKMQRFTIQFFCK